MLNIYNKFRTLILLAIAVGFSSIPANSLFSGWDKLNTSGSVPHLKNHTAVYISQGNYMIVFGGRTLTGISGELWKLDLTNNQWSQLLPAGITPLPRYTQNAYYDSLTGEMIIWAGQGTELYNDVWAYNISANSWHLLWPDGNVSGAPLKRYGTASVFEPVKRRFTTFAGFTTSGRFDDTWSFNVDSMQWTDRTNTIHPPKRCLHSAVFAENLNRFVIYGGQDTGPLDDIWQCDLSNFTWINITPVLKPPARFWNSAVYSGNGLIIFGGLGSNPLGDMWKFTFSSNSWEPVDQGLSTPAPRWGHTAVYIPQQDRMVIFGGEGDSSYSDTWQFSNLSVIGIEPASEQIPVEYTLKQNYPNPFNPETIIEFNIKPVTLQDKQNVKLVVYDVLGKEVKLLFNGLLGAGEYSIKFTASDLPGGVYFYRLIVNNRKSNSPQSGYTETKKMILVK